MDGARLLSLFSRAKEIHHVQYAHFSISFPDVMAWSVDPLLNANKGATYRMAAKGFQTTATFEEYVTWVIPQLPSVAPGLWRLLVLDGYGPHCISPKALASLLQANIYAVIIPSHSSHLLQLQVIDPAAMLHLTYCVLGCISVRSAQTSISKVRGQHSTPRSAPRFEQMANPLLDFSSLG
jgi:DDE superfamily endonuclease